MKYINSCLAMVKSISERNGKQRHQKIWKYFGPWNYMSGFPVGEWSSHVVREMRIKGFVLRLLRKKWFPASKKHNKLTELTSGKEDAFAWNSRGNTKEIWFSPGWGNQKSKKEITAFHIMQTPLWKKVPMPQHTHQALRLVCYHKTLVKFFITLCEIQEFYKNANTSFNKFFAPLNLTDSMKGATKDFFQWILWGS